MRSGYTGRLEEVEGAWRMLEYYDGCLSGESRSLEHPFQICEHMHLYWEVSSIHRSTHGSAHDAHRRRKIGLSSEVQLNELEPK